MSIKLFLLSISLGIACHSDPPSSTDIETPDGTTKEAQVLRIKTSGVAQNYTFEVEVKSPDSGCDQYADWWEVITEDAQLIYRRILAHSHVNEQPFRRSGGPVKIDANQKVLIRVHMNNLGYSTKGMLGSIHQGFEPFDLEEGFGAMLAEMKPLPGDCPN